MNIVSLFDVGTVCIRFQMVQPCIVLETKVVVGYNVYMHWYIVKNGLSVLTRLLGHTFCFKQHYYDDNNKFYSINIILRVC